MILKIYKLGCDNEPLCVLNEGEHPFGSGGILECSDPRVEKCIGKFTVGQHISTITSIHELCDCFFQSANNNHTYILPRDKPQELQDCDKFALLSDEYWFKIRLGDADNSEEDLATNRTHVDVKRELSSDYLEENAQPNKRLKEEATEERTNGVSEDENHSEQEEGPTANQELEHESVDNEESNATSLDPSNVQNQSNDTAPVATTSHKRERCWYGSSCYRKLPAHKREFSHPGDNDFEENDSDSRPSCSYGSKCYRRNKQHRQQFKHTNDQNQTTQTRTRKRPKQNTRRDESSEDEYDLEDPFIDTGSEFELSGSSGSDEVDTEPEDDSGEMKRLLKESKRFTRKK